jgi:hypothetical protein
MSARGVLASANRAGGRVGADERDFAIPAGGKFPVQKLVGMAEAESAKISEVKRIFCKRGGDVAERVGALVNEIRGIGRGSNAERIENE